MFLIYRLERNCSISAESETLEIGLSVLDLWTHKTSDKTPGALTRDSTIDGIRVVKNGKGIDYYDLINEGFWYRNWHSRLALAKKTSDPRLKALLNNFTPILGLKGDDLVIRIGNDTYNAEGQRVGSSKSFYPRMPPPDLPWLKPMHLITVETNGRPLDTHNESVSGKCIWTGEPKKCEPKDLINQNMYLDGRYYGVYNYLDTSCMRIFSTTDCLLFYDTINEPYWYKDELSRLVLADKMEEEGNWKLATILRKFSNDSVIPS
jgi:hypothetical protein